MKQLTEKEWGILRTMCQSLRMNLADMGGYYETWDTLIEEEVELLKKIAE